VVLHGFVEPPPFLGGFMIIEFNQTAIRNSIKKQWQLLFIDKRIHRDDYFEMEIAYNRREWHHFDNLIRAYKWLRVNGIGRILNFTR
jgi:hypothetical protein